MNFCELTMSVTALANAIACNLSTEDLDLFSAVLTQLGDTLATISAQRTRCENKQNKSSE